jgi:hypothetical protein
MVRAHRIGLVLHDNEMVRSQRVVSVLRKIEFVLVGSRILGGTRCVEKTMFVADIGLQMAVGVVEVGEPS